MNNKSMGDRIKFHRKRLGLTQEQLAERMGVSAQAVSKWENNLSCPDISILPELAEVFGITVDALLGKESTPPVHAAELVEEEEKGFTFHWDGMKGNAQLGSILFALYVLTVGALLLVNNLCQLSPSWWTIVWTTALIYIGVSGMIGKFSFFCLVMSLAGVYFLLSAYELFSFRLGWGVVIPVFLLIWGLSLFFDHFLGRSRRKRTYREAVRRHGKKMHHEYSCEGGYLDCDLSFGEYRVAVVTPLLKGGNIDSCFGDFTVDFSACEAIAPGCRISVDNSFGRLTLLVPEKYAVSFNHDENFAAGVEVKGAPMQEPEATMSLDSDTSFGTLQIRYV